MTHRCPDCLAIAFAPWGGHISEGRFPPSGLSHTASLRRKRFNHRPFQLLPHHMGEVARRAGGGRVTRDLHLIFFGILASDQQVEQPFVWQSPSALRAPPPYDGGGVIFASTAIFEGAARPGRVRASDLPNTKSARVMKTESPSALRAPPPAGEEIVLPRCVNPLTREHGRRVTLKHEHA